MKCSQAFIYTDLRRNIRKSSVLQPIQSSSQWLSDESGVFYLSFEELSNGTATDVKLKDYSKSMSQTKGFFFSLRRNLCRLIPLLVSMFIFIFIKYDFHCINTVFTLNVRARLRPLHRNSSYDLYSISQKGGNSNYEEQGSKFLRIFHLSP